MVVDEPETIALGSLGLLMTKVWWSLCWGDGDRDVTVIPKPVVMDPVDDAAMTESHESGGCSEMASAQLPLLDWRLHGRDLTCCGESQVKLTVLRLQWPLLLPGILIWWTEPAPVVDCAWGPVLIVNKLSLPKPWPRLTLVCCDWGLGTKVVEFDAEIDCSEPGRESR